ncbi:hypothetical protein L228DRAFT_51584 [Xylona heveae TC161]|uniref:Uncharacterized protein n=1 Tax=Xylona heveae (strain CBS 132557 / TC161) TaxID=1328760 RepID=A0A164ZDJ5_XYLHT|nr:hypothetical protein L228DRAFT_51584 [Xylona heveae TC161]KZF18964.1 hypothetical protein L228DRAFT_51584 [Xylona heveae TC161]
MAAHGQFELPARRTVRSQSVASDRVVTAGYSFLQAPPVSVNPGPAYIAPAAASQIATAHHVAFIQERSGRESGGPTGDVAIIAPVALSLINTFLDHLLYTILSVSRSTSLPAIKPALSDILRPKLARDAIAEAEEELEGFLDGGESEELLAAQGFHDIRGNWDLELVWKRTRLRCMVYSRLGDLEEDDEEVFNEEAQLDEFAGAHRPFSADSDVISSPVAIFLASVIEFIGEQVLVVAAKAAFDRFQLSNAKLDQQQNSATAVLGTGHVVIEELDAEKVAMNPTLGRLWRAWRKHLRSASTPFARPMSRNSIFRQSNLSSMASPSSLRSSTATPDGGHAASREPPTTSLPEEPISQNVESLAYPTEGPKDSSGSNAQDHAGDEIGNVSVSRIRSQRRPHSMFIPAGLPAAPVAEGESFSTSTNNKRHSFMPTTRYMRSRSLPSNERKPDLSFLPEEPSTKPSIPSIQEHDAQNSHLRDLLANMVANASAIGTSALEGITAAAKGEAPDAQVTPADETRMDLDQISNGKPTSQISYDDEEPQIMNSSRVSFEGSTPVEVVQTRSGAPSSSWSFTTAEATHRRSTEGESYRQGQHDTDGDESVIGLARSSDVPSPVPSKRSSSVYSSGIADMLSRRSDRDSRALSERSLGVPSDEASNADKRRSRFVLMTPPVPRSQRSSAASSLSERTETPGEASEPGMLETRRSILDAGSAPPLSPLRELVEAAGGGSDDEDSVFTGYDTVDFVHAYEDNSPVVSSFKTEGFTSGAAKEQEPSLLTKSVHEMHSENAPGGAKLPTEPALALSPLEQSVPAAALNNASNARDVSAQSSLQPKSPTASTAPSTSGTTPNDASFANRPRQPSLPSRDARIQNESTRDFADFIRSTGPANEAVNQPAALHISPPLTPRPPTSVSSKSRTPTITTSPKRKEIGMSPTGLHPIISDARRDIPPSAGSSSTRRFQARDAATSNADTSSDLIDFIRQGPPSDPYAHRFGGQGNGGLKSVAPTRTTMDSDELSVAGNGRSRGVVSMASTVESSVNAKSGHSSMNSRTGLLSHPNGFDKPTAAHVGRLMTSDPPVPQRKQRRVRDPYAIDSDSEDDELEENIKPKRNEESLIDFLRNVPPPFEPEPPRPVSSHTQKSGRTILQKSPGPKAKSRAGGKAISKGAISKPTLIPLPPQHAAMPSLTTSGAPHLSLNQHLHDSPLLPDSLRLGNTHLDAMSRTTSIRSTQSSNPDPVRHVYIPPSRSGPRSGPNFQARSGRLDNSSTSDLADFLKNSGPPPGWQSQPKPLPILVKEESTFSRVFGRRKKTAA